MDAPDATRASPDGDANDSILPGTIKQEDIVKSESPLSDAPDVFQAPKERARTTATPKMNVKQEENKVKLTQANSIPKRQGTIDDPEADLDEEAEEEEIVEALSRPPPVNSDYLPLPWKGRLGYACLNTYLRQSNPPVFSSRTCRIQSILEHRHPLQDPTQPEHPTKNRPDKDQPVDVALGKKYVEAICLANVRDITKMIRWNDRYGIKFFRLSSEMFPFASHPEYGYKLAPFAADALEEAGKVIAELGHRVTTHPGQFTQLGSPRQPVIDNSIRDLAYHAELLSLLKLPEQQNRDAVMILHMGGIFEGKQETLQRFRGNYAKLPQNVKDRLVLENDDMCWNVHDLLPICEEFNIPMVLDYHHHNIIFDKSQIREGTKDIMELYPRIKATWDRKRITQKMHYSEPTPAAVTGKQRRKHSPRVATLPPCAPDMDLMIEAKDKEQAVFEVMRTFKLPGYDSFNDIVPHVRNDDNKVALANINKKKKKSSDKPEGILIPEEEVGMGGPEGRVYWPPGMEEWLRPKKREVKPKEEKSKAQIIETNEKLYAESQARKKNATAKSVFDEPESEDSDVNATQATKKAKAAMRRKKATTNDSQPTPKKQVKKAAKAVNGRKKKAVKTEDDEDIASTPSESDEEDDFVLPNEDEGDAPVGTAKRRTTRGR